LSVTTLPARSACSNTLANCLPAVRRPRSPPPPPRLSKQVIFDALVSREKLGSTGLGKGVAIPHGRMAELEEPVCAFIRVKNPVDFDASDGQPVDLVFSLLVPEESTEEHLQVLSTIAEIFSNPGICNALRQCDDGTCVLEQLYQWESQRISA
jgi:PTS system nitrogen regulatory IIA component